MLLLRWWSRKLLSWLKVKRPFREGTQLLGFLNVEENRILSITIRSRFTLKAFISKTSRGEETRNSDRTWDLGSLQCLEVVDFTVWGQWSPPHTHTCHTARTQSGVNERWRSKVTESMWSYGSGSTRSETTDLRVQNPKRKQNPGVQPRKPSPAFTEPVRFPFSTVFTDLFSLLLLRLPSHFWSAQPVFGLIESMVELLSSTRTWARAGCES